MPEMSRMVEIWIFAGLAVMVLLFLMSGMARLYRKAGPHEALIVYGLGGDARCARAWHAGASHGPDLQGFVSGADVVRRGASAGSLYQAGRRGDGRSRGANQSEIRSGVCADGGRA